MVYVVVSRLAALAANQFIIDDPRCDEEAVCSSVAVPVVPVGSSNGRRILCKRQSSLMHLLLPHMTPLTDTALLNAV